MLLLVNEVLREYNDTNPDTDVVSYLTNQCSESQVISAVVLNEYFNYYDISGKCERKRYELRELFTGVVLIDEDPAIEAASMQNSLESAGTTLSSPDLFIVATVRQRGATLVTANRTDFEKEPIHLLKDAEVIDVSLSPI